MSFDLIFNPSSIAIIGGSAKPNTVGNDLVKNLKNGFKGTIYPINPKVEEILELKTYAGIAELPIRPELVIIAVPAQVVLQVFGEVAKLGVKAVIIISAGFGELGVEGRQMENEIKNLAKLNQITLVGVNCLGVMNVKEGINATFAKELPLAGNIALVAQSGAICTAAIDFSHNLGLSFSKIISLGNKTFFSEIELLKYLDKDETTKVIAMYLEDITNPLQFLEAIKNIQKPIVILKSGNSQEGKKATSSHTGALAGSQEAYDTLFREAGILIAKTIQELFYYSLFLATNPLPTSQNLTIITNAGGPGTLCVDAATEAGLNLVKLENSSLEFLKVNLPNSCSLNNPIDLLGDADSSRYQLALETVLKDKNVDNLIIILTPQASTDIENIAKIIVEHKQKYNKVIIACFMGNNKVQTGVNILQVGKVTTIPYPDLAAQLLGNIYQNQKQKRLEPDLSQVEFVNTGEERNQVKKLLDQEIIKFKQKNNQETEFNLPEHVAKEILSLYNLPTLQTHIATNPEEATKYAKILNQKMAFKIISPDIIHKTEAGGVMLDIKIEDADQAYKQLLEQVSQKNPTAKLEGVLMMEMVESSHGFEFILGVKTEPGFGKLIMLGVGGIMIEIIQDVTFGLAPLNRLKTINMINKLKSKKILDGYRGKPPLDTELLVNSLLQLSQLVTEFPEIIELDINPLLLKPANYSSKILDARIRLKIS